MLVHSLSATNCGCFTIKLASVLFVLLIDNYFLPYQILGFPRTRMSRSLCWQDVKLVTKNSHVALTVGWKTISTRVGRMRTGLPYAVPVWLQEFRWNSRI
ncbi:unnamed protein product [Musa acuminata var. zebrina]